MMPLKTFCVSSIRLLRLSSTVSAVSSREGSTSYRLLGSLISSGVTGQRDVTG